MKNLLIIIFLANFSIAGRAAEFLDGYIVLANNDTIECKFKIGGFVSATNFFNKLTIVTRQGEEQVYHARDKKVLAYSVLEKGRIYTYRFVETKVKSETGFYQRVVNGGKYKLYLHLVGTYGSPGINVAQPNYVLFSPSGEYEKFDPCILCPWKKQLRQLLRDDQKALEILENASRLDIPKFVLEIDKQ
jgi:hypothetical protein